MMWTWSEVKNRQTVAKHGIDFALAQDVFDDPLAATRFDMNYEGEERWQTMGLVGPALILVVHTLPEGAKAGRIISARAASRHERKGYEEGYF
jgi:uncharacterized protein